MTTILDFLGSGTIGAALAVAGLLGGAVVLVRVALRDMFASPLWRMQNHLDD